MSDKIDLLVLTALTEEAQVVRAVLDAVAHPVQSHNDLHLYEYFGKGDKAFSIAAACAHDQGAVDMGVFASPLLERLRPRSASLVGIAALVDKSVVEVGDVPFAIQVISYDDIAVEDGALTFRTDGFQVDPYMLAAAGELRTSPDSYAPWQKSSLEIISRVVDVVNQLRSKPMTIPELVRAPHIVTGITGGGPFLLRDAGFRDALKQSAKDGGLPKYRSIPVTNSVHPKLVSAEMESHGFMRAAHKYNIPASVLKGISDDGNRAKARLEKKTGGFFRAYACSNAILAALHALDHLSPHSNRGRSVDRPLVSKSAVSSSDQDPTSTTGEPFSTTSQKLDGTHSHLVSKFARDIFQQGFPLAVITTAVEYAELAQALAESETVTYLLWTVNGSPLDVRGWTGQNDYLTEWDRAFQRSQCEKRRIVVFRSESERLDYLETSDPERKRRRKAFEDSCGNQLRFTSVNVLQNRFPSLRGEASLDIGYVSTYPPQFRAFGTCFHSPFATDDFTTKEIRCASVVLFDTGNLVSTDKDEKDHEEAANLLGRLNAHLELIRAVRSARDVDTWLLSNAGDVPVVVDRRAEKIDELCRLAQVIVEGKDRQNKWRHLCKLLPGVAPNVLAEVQQRLGYSNYGGKN